MDFLIRRQSFSKFLRTMIIPLSLYGLGSVESLLNLKMYQLYELHNSMNDENIVSLFKKLHNRE